jgi:hypothetical protein
MVRILTNIIPNRKKNKMDVMSETVEGKEYACLVLINITTRKLYPEEINIGGIEKKSEKVIYEALIKIISKTKLIEPIKVIRCDSEQAFTTQDVQDYRMSQNITLLPVQKFDGNSHHTALAIVDRVIITIPDKATEHSVLIIKQLHFHNNVQHAFQTYNNSLLNVG